MERFPLYLMLLLFPCNLAEDCPDETWYDTGNPDLGCIFFGGKAKTWVEAHEECEGYVGHMAEATTMEQADDLYALAKIIGDIRNVKRWWLGLTDIIKEGDWHWAYSYENGSVQTSDFETIWTPDATEGNPNDCVIMKEDDGKLSWADIPCHDTTTDQTTLDIQVLCQCVGEEECSATPPTPEPTDSPGPTCDAGWIVNEGLGCIKPLADGVDASTVEKAENECKKVLDGTGSDDGVLVEPHDACKQAALEDFLKYPLKKDVWWIGLKWSADDDNWAWTSETKYDNTTTDWGPGSEQFPDLLPCVAIELVNGERHWYNRPCSDPSPKTTSTICVQDPAYECKKADGSSTSSTASTAEGETTTTTPGTDTTTEPQGCQHNPSDAEGPCYLVKDEAKSFQEAEDYCVGLGGHLASAHLASENNYIGSLLSGRPYWWIGAQCGDGTTCTATDSWAWTDGSTWDYENWVTDAGSKACAFYERSTKNWRSWSCASKFPFVCKI